ncbi:MAG: DUF1653 domain-containing protein [Lachnospiraceae bacterium]|nr:DUF1653 domain-containing protein [Lachnospiraceae bacterium]
MSFTPKPEEIYKHFKGNLYKIVTIATHSETGEELVIYQALYGDFKTYARPLAEFTSPVDKEKYPDAAQEFRFELQEAGADNAGGGFTLDPLVEEFLDARGYQERLNIIEAIRHRATDDMINTMAVACDIEVPEGGVNERLDSLKRAIRTMDRFEGTRMRP